MTKSKRGRRTLLTPQLQRKICKLLEGHSIATVCQAVGIGERTYFEWCERHPHFAQAATRAIGRSKMVLTDKLRASDDWRAQAFLLERRWPNEFGRTAERPLPNDPDPNQNKINVAVVCNITKPLDQLLNFPTEGDVEPSTSKPFPLVEPEYRFNRRTGKGEPIEPLPEIDDESEPEPPS